MARRFTALVGLSTHTHLHARVHRECGFMQRYGLRRMDNRIVLRLFSLWENVKLCKYSFIHSHFVGLKCANVRRLTCAWRRCSQWLSAPGGRRCEMGHGNGTCRCSWASGEHYTSGWSTGETQDIEEFVIFFFWSGGCRPLNMAS